MGVASRCFSATAALGAALVAISANAETGDVDLDALRAEYERPLEIPFPENNPYTDEKYDLGHKLFFDPRLSGSGAISCATCHNPGLGWEDGLATGIGPYGFAAWAAYADGFEPCLGHALFLGRPGRIGLRSRRSGRSKPKSR